MDEEIFFARRYDLRVGATGPNMPDMALIVLLLIFVGIPAAVTLAIPTRYLGHYALCVLMLELAGQFRPTAGGDHSALFSGTDLEVERGVGYVIAIAVLLKLAVAGLRYIGLTASGNAAATQRSVPQTETYLVNAATGVVTGFCAVTLVALLAFDMRPTWHAHAAPFLVLGVAALIAFMAWHILGLAPRVFATAFALSTVATLAAGGVWVSTRINAVIASAEYLAGEGSYCIQVAGRFGPFRLAISRLDLSPLTMRTQCEIGWCYQNHAILAIEGGGALRLMSWSHRAVEFRNDVLNAATKPPKVVCIPSPHFSRALPLL